MARDDQNYVVDLCDELLQEQALREYRFDFLRGDPCKNGKGRTLPVDAYYPKKNLVIEYYERQHLEAIPHFDKPSVMTVSGVSRGEQRKIYYARRREVLPKQGKKIVIISYSDLAHTSRKRLLRDREDDLKAIREIFKKNKVNYG